MAYGILEYDISGLVKCEICGLFFDRVICHVRQKHFVDGQDYKKRFGFDLYKGICSKQSHDMARDKVYANYDKCINGNLVKNGEKTRYKIGGAGRTRDKLSEQTKIRLSTRLDDYHTGRSSGKFKKSES